MVNSDYSAFQQVFTSGIFVGRERELGVLTTALEDVLAGKGRVIMLAGEPGIGKTRTAAELTSIAEDHGCQILFGTCYEGQGAPPFWPWAQPIKAYLRNRDTEAIQAVLGKGAPFISEMVPELRDYIPDLETIPSQDSKQGIFRKFSAVEEFLRNAASIQPLVLVLDDLHLSDVSSLDLLEFIMREIESIPILVIGTYRSSEVTRRHPLTQVIGTLMSRSFFHRIEMGGLRREEIQEYIRFVTEENPSDELVSEIHIRTEGNPLFVNEFARLLSNEGLPSGEDWSPRPPEGIIAAIGRRLNGLSAECNDVLTMASVIGKEFRLKVLSDLAKAQSKDSLLDTIDEALEARVILEMPSAPEAYQFAHGLIRETLLLELAFARQVQLHAQIGNSLEKIYVTEKNISPAEIAFHFTKAKSVTDASKIVTYELLAGEEALAAYSYKEAQNHFSEAEIAKKEMSESSSSQCTDDEYAAIFLGLGHTQAALYQLDEAVRNLERAFDYYLDSGDVQIAVSIAGFAHSVPFVRLFGNCISQAKDLATPGSIQAAEVFANYGFFLGTCSEDFNTAYRYLEEALSIARRESDLALESRIIAGLAEVMGEHLKWEESREKSIEAITLTQDSDADRLAKLRAHIWASGSNNVLGNPEASSFHAREAMQIAETMHDYFWGGISALLLAAISYDTGEWDTSRILTDKGLSVSKEEVFLLSLRTVLEYEQGNFEEGLKFLNILVEQLQKEIYKQRRTSMSMHAGVLAIGAACQITGGDVPGVQIAELVAQHMLNAGGISPNSQLFIRTGLSLIAIQKGDQDMARGNYAILNQRAGRPSLSGEINLDRVLGLLAQKIGRFDEAEVHFETAIKFGKSSGYRPQLAWSYKDYAEFLLSRDKKGDRQKARILLEQSLQIADHLKMRPLKERVQQNMEEASNANPYDLTRREIDILKFLSSNLTYYAIGESLIPKIRERTVITHTQNIFEKMGVNTRQEAAVLASESGLIEHEGDSAQS